MFKRTTVFAALAALLALAVAGPASAQSTLVVELEPAGLGYNSDGTFEGLADVLDEACAAVGRQDIPEVGSLCVPRPVDEDAGQQPGDNGYELAQLGGAIGWSSDGFFADTKRICFVGSFVGHPIEEQRIEIAPGVSVTACKG